MSGDNIIQFGERRRVQSEGLSAQVTQRDADRTKETVALLEKLGLTKRLVKEDQQTLVKNLGRVIIELAPDRPLDVARKVLPSEHWLKRKRYIRFESDDANTSSELHPVPKTPS
jgi:hypothetical protein